MREQRNHSERTTVLENSEPRKKYFLVYEGTDTEPIYFDALERNKEYFKKNPLIDMVPIAKGYSKEGWSNPKKLYDGFMADLNASNEGTVTYNTLIDYLIDVSCPGHVSPKSLCRALKAICTGPLNIGDLDKPVPVEEINTLCHQLADEMKLTKLVVNISQIIKEYTISYQSDFDKICFIIDRDKDSFVEDDGTNQYSYVLSKCKENGFGFYISNPCFEFWLLLHFEETKELDLTMLLDNKKINSLGQPSKNGKTYTEQQLCKLLTGFQKKRYNADSLMPRINIALEQEALWCEDPEELEHNVGSRVGLLIKELRGDILE